MFVCVISFQGASTQGHTDEQERWFWLISDVNQHDMLHINTVLNLYSDASSFKNKCGNNSVVSIIVHNSIHHLFKNLLFYFIPNISK